MLQSPFAFSVMLSMSRLSRVLTPAQVQDRGDGMGVQRRLEALSAQKSSPRFFVSKSRPNIEVYLLRSLTGKQRLGQGSKPVVGGIVSECVLEETRAFMRSSTLQRLMAKWQKLSTWEAAKKPVWQAGSRSVAIQLVLVH